MAKETAPADTVKFPPAVTNGILKCTDLAYALWPQRKPKVEAIQQTCLVGHRGCKEVAGIQENTFAAFDYAVENGMHGIEIDIRWTADQKIVLAHDPDLQRVYGRPEQIIDLTLKELQQLCPEIPTLSETIERYRDKLRFFIELKKDNWDQFEQQQIFLMSCLGELKPVTDYYLMSFDLGLLERFNCVDATCKIAIAHSNPSRVRQYIRDGKAQNFGGHFLLVNQACRDFCRSNDVGIALGFPASANSLYREISRGTEFILVDDPKKAAKWLGACGLKAT